VLLAQATGGKQPYAYTWSDPSFQGPGPFQVCPGQTTKYSVIVTDSSAHAGEVATGNQSVTATGKVACTPADGAAPLVPLHGCVTTTDGPGDAGIDAGGIMTCTEDTVDSGTVAFLDGGAISATVGAVRGTLLKGHAYQFSYDRLLPINFGNAVSVDVFGTTDDDICKADQKLFSLNLDGSIFNWHQSYCFTPDRDYHYALTRVYIQGVFFYFNALATGTLCDTCSNPTP
jgi:hypothetical protein